MQGTKIPPTARSAFPSTLQGKEILLESSQLQLERAAGIAINCKGSRAWLVGSSTRVFLHGRFRAALGPRRLFHLAPEHGCGGWVLGRRPYVRPAIYRSLRGKSACASLDAWHGSATRTHAWAPGHECLPRGGTHTHTRDREGGAGPGRGGLQDYSQAPKAAVEISPDLPNSTPYV